MDKSNTLEHKRLFVVLGMHRCGTSAITRGLQVMGVYLGDRLMLLDAGNNDKGFWEDIDINALNVEMLNALNNDWHHLSLIKQEDLELLKHDGFFHRAAELIQLKTISTSIFGFKDPRISKLLPFWKEVFQYCKYDVSYILAVRHPISVALSLAKRNGIDMEKSHLLWLIHMVKSLSGITGCNYIVADYDKLMQDADHELNRIAKKFHLKINLAELEIYKSEFLDHNLRHAVFTYDDLMQHDRTPDFLRDVYTTIMDMAADSPIDEVKIRRKTETWEAELEKLNLSFNMADKAFKHIDLVHQQLAEKETLILREKEEKEDGIKKLNASLKKADELTAQIDLVNQQLAKKENIITDNKIIIAGKAEIIADQEEVITAKEHIIAEKERIILQEIEEKNSILASRSWRITQPFRYTAKLLRNLSSNHR
jgi:O-antigen biosynthesis protein